jgi:hypothetical protein
MVTIRVSITRWISDNSQPGLIECQLVDAHGRCWSFIDKVAIVCADHLNSESQYPQPGAIAAEVIGRVRDATGHALIRIDTDRPWGIQSVEGEHQFEVSEEALVDGTGDGDSLTSELLEWNSAFQALVTKSKAGPRKPLTGSSDS